MPGNRRHSTKQSCLLKEGVRAHKQRGAHVQAHKQALLNLLSTPASHRSGNPSTCRQLRSPQPVYTGARQPGLSHCQLVPSFYLSHTHNSRSLSLSNSVLLARPVGYPPHRSHGLAPRTVGVHSTSSNALAHRLLTWDSIIVWLPGCSCSSGWRHLSTATSRGSEALASFGQSCSTGWRGRLRLRLLTALAALEVHSGL